MKVALTIHGAEGRFSIAVLNDPTPERLGNILSELSAAHFGVEVAVMTDAEESEGGEYDNRPLFD